MKAAEPLSPTRAALVALATFRLTRLVTQDYITEDLRRRLKARLPEKPAYLITCPWCASPYLAAAVAALALRRRPSRLVDGLLLTLACSAVAGLIATYDPPEDYGVKVEAEAGATVVVPAAANNGD